MVQQPCKSVMMPMIILTKRAIILKFEAQGGIPGFTTKAFLSKATFKSLDFLGSCGGWAFGIERFLKVLRLSALTRLIRNLLLRLSEISLAEIGLRQIWMRWLGGRSSSMSEIQKREKARRWIFKRQIKKMAKLICQLKFFNGTRIIFITPYK